MVKFYFLLFKLYKLRPYISMRIKFCFMTPFLPLTCLSSSLQSASCTLVSLQPLHITQALTLTTKLPIVNTLRTGDADLRFYIKNLQNG